MCVPESLKFWAKVGQKVLLEIRFDNDTVYARSKGAEKSWRLYVDLHQFLKAAFPEAIDYQLVVLE